MQQTRSPYQIAMIQMDCDLFHVSNNLAKAEKQIRKAAAHGAKLICLPEACGDRRWGFPDTDACPGEGTFGLSSGSNSFIYSVWRRKLCFFD